MARLKSPHSDFRLPLISPVDVRAVELDSLLTQLWLRVLLDDRRPMRRTLDYTTIAELAQEIEREGNEHFRGFDRAQHATEAWLRADLVRPLKREPTMYTVARPLHANAVRLRTRNKGSDDSNASAAIYAWLWHCDRPLLDDLRSLITATPDLASADLVTLGLFHLGGAHEEDRPADPVESGQPTAPPSITQARLYAEDVRRLLAYEDVMPRPGLIAHLRRLTAFHLGLYLLRVFALVAAMAEGSVSGPESDLELIVDFGEDARGPVARLAESSWAEQDLVMQRYVRGHLALKKLHQFAERERELRKTPLPESLAALVSLETDAPQARLDAHFDAALQSLLDDNGDDADELGRQVAQYREMGMSPFRVYHAVIVHLKGSAWVGYHRQLIDSLLAKNTRDGLLRQPLGGQSQRRAAMGAALLETLTFVALVRDEPAGFKTRPLRVDELITELETRYGFCIATTPRALAEDLDAARVLAANRERFKARLRETGLFTDLSDAFVAQLVRPRFSIG